MKMKKIFTLLLASCVSLLGANANPTDSGLSIITPKEDKIQRVGEIERDINKRVYAYKGEWITGLSASYYTFSSENSDFLLFVDNIDADFAMTSIKPFVGYLYRNNRAVGMRLGYSFIDGTLDEARIDLGVDSDIQIDIPYIHTSGRYYTGSLFHRAYAALDAKGNFGLFAEVELGATGGYSIFEYQSGGTYLYTRSDKRSVDLSFNPGVSMFIMNNVSTSLSFEFGGISYTNIKQYDENGVYTGGRDASGMSFKFNMLAINFGITIHIW